MHRLFIAPILNSYHTSIVNLHNENEERKRKAKNIKNMKSYSHCNMK